MIAKAPSADSRRGTISILTLGALALFAAAYLGLDVGNYEHRLSVNLSKLNGKATYAQVCALMQEGGAFRYDGTYHLNPQSPAVTEARRAGDCTTPGLNGMDLVSFGFWTSRLISAAQPRCQPANRTIRLPTPIMPRSGS